MTTLNKTKKSNSIPPTIKALINKGEYNTLLEMHTNARQELDALTAKAKDETPTASLNKKIQAKNKLLNTLDYVITKECGIVTAWNIERLSESIAVQSLKTCYQRSGQPFIYKLYNELILDINARKKNNKPLSDAYDIVQEACVFLCEYIGRSLNEPLDGITLDKKGNPVTISRACFRKVGRYIDGERQHEYKRTYVDDIDENGNAVYYEIPSEWDTPTLYDYKCVNKIIKELKLSQNDMRFLAYRLRGYSLETITQKMGVTRGAINKYRQRVKDKATASTSLAQYFSK